MIVIVIFFRGLIGFGLGYFLGGGDEAGRKTGVTTGKIRIFILVIDYRYRYRFAVSSFISIFIYIFFLNKTNNQIYIFKSHQRYLLKKRVYILRRNLSGLVCKMHYLYLLFYTSVNSKNSLSTFDFALK